MSSDADRSAPRTFADEEVRAIFAAAADREAEADRAGATAPSGPVDDATWERIVVTLRDEFGGPGSTSRFGEVLEWVGPEEKHVQTERAPARRRPGPPRAAGRVS